MITVTLSFVASDAENFYYVLNEQEKVIGVIKWRSSYYLAENHLSKLESLLNEFIELGSTENFWNNVNSVSNWGNGWEWTESVHKIAEQYSLSNSVTWFTTINNNELSVKDFCDEENIPIDYSGITISLRHKNNQPTPLCYFFRVR